MGSQSRSLAGYSPWGRKVGHDWVTNTHLQVNIQFFLMFNILDIRHILVALSFLLKFYLHFFVFGLHCCHFFLFKYIFVFCCQTLLDFLGGSDDQESACNAGDLSSILVLGRLPGEGNGNLLQYSRLGNPMDRGAWWATDHGVAKSWTWLSH